MKKMYTIGQVSELFDLPKSTIRYWDEQGLIRVQVDKKRMIIDCLISMIFLCFMISFFIEN